MAMPRSAAASAGTASAPRCRPLSMRRLPTRIWRPAMGPVTPLPASAPSTSPRLSAARTLAAPSGCWLWHCRRDDDDAGLAFGQRAGFVDRKACGPLQPLAGLGIVDQYARLRAESDRHHDGHWRCQAEFAGRQVGRSCCASYRPVRGACHRQRQRHRAEAQDSCAGPRTLVKPGPAGTNCRQYR